MIGSQLYSQKNINDFKYVVVPKSYDFLAKEDAYQLNSLTVFLLKKYGFEAYIKGKEMPKEIIENNCTVLTTDVKKKSSFLSTKLIVELIDCRGEAVFTSSMGSSGEKDFKKAYHEALRDAFADIEKLNYKYNQTSGNTTSKTTKVSPPPSNQEKPVSKVEKKKVKAQNTVTKNILTANLPSLTYTFNNDLVIFKKQAFGYEIVRKEKLTPLGIIYKLSRKNDYLIDAGDLSGSGYFDNYGNFVLERINPVTKKVITDIFARN